MKKLLFVSSLEGVGGTEISLLNLLQQIDKEKVSVDLALIGERGPLVEKVPDWIRIVWIESKTPKEYVASALKKKKVLTALQGVRRYAFLRNNWKRTHVDTMCQYEHSLYLYSPVKEKYDVAITWYVPNSIHTVFTLNNVTAKRKVMWIHMDVSMDFMPSDSETVLQEYDRIYCVSKACKMRFDEKYKSCQSKTEVYYNVIDVSELKKAGMVPVPGIIEGKFYIATSGRIAPEKQPLYAIQIVESLVSSGIRNFVWLFIGDGVLRKDLEQKVENKNLQDYFVFLGRLDNPYAYIRKSNLYVQMSLHESFCLTLAEAQVLGIPSISTDFPSAYEIVQNGKTGCIVPNSCEEIARSIKQFITHPDIYSKMRNDLEHYELKCIGTPQQLLSYVYEGESEF